MKMIADPPQKIIPKWEAPPQFAPGYYFRQAIAIAKFDAAAIRAAAADENALLYGAFIWAVGQLVLFAGLAAPAMARQPNTNWAVIAMGGAVAVILDAGAAVCQYAICHLLGQWIFGAHGRIVELLRALSLGSIVVWLFVIPYAGLVVGALWSIAVMMRVFEEVDGIKKLQAFGLALGTGALFWIFALLLIAPKG